MTNNKMDSYYSVVSLSEFELLESITAIPIHENNSGSIVKTVQDIDRDEVFIIFLSFSPLPCKGNPASFEG